MESKDVREGSGESEAVRPRQGEGGSQSIQPNYPHDALDKPLSLYSPGAAAAARATNGWSYEDEPETYEEEFHGAGHEKETLKSLHWEIQKEGKELEKVKRDINGLLKNVNDLMNMPKAFAAIHDKQELFQGVLATFNKDVMAVHSRLDKLKLSPNFTDPGVYEKLQKKCQELERAVTSLRQYGQKIDERLVSLETSYTGVFLWKIANYVEKKRDAMNMNIKSIYSPPFFTSQYGYKLCGRVFLMGDGVGKGTHISLFLTIMKGPFDAVLPWPFKERITFQLVNQDDPLNKSITESFSPDPASSSFKRPTTENNIGAGCPSFANIQMIEDPKSGFVRDNTIYMKIIAQTSDVSEIESLEE